MKRTRPLLAALLLVLAAGLWSWLGAAQGADMKQFAWDIDNLTAIGGAKVTVVGQPAVIETERGKAVRFDGVKDGLVLDIDPLEGAAAFTVEAMFKPDADGPREQRFVHIQEDGSENRIMLETRVVDGKWYGDTYIRSARGDRALNDPKLTHPTGQWHTLALVFDGQTMTQYVDGVRELTGKVKSAPHGKGRTAIGMRMNQVHWFKGAIRHLRVTHAALPADKLLKP